MWRTVASAAGAMVVAVALAGFARAPQREKPGGARPHPPPTAGACTTCHEDLLRRKVVHGPVALGKCDVCHTSAAQGAPFTMTGSTAAAIDRRGMCVGCHTDIAERLNAKFVHAPVEAGGCTVCHDPHGSEFRFMLASDGKGACLMCHETVGDELADRFSHEPASRSCAVCHDPHGTSHPAQTREGLNDLCLRCHFDPPLTDEDGTGRVFARVLLPLEADLGAKGRRIGLDASMTRGHPMMRHPVAGKDDPSDPGHPLTCASCHAPHGAGTKRLLAYAAPGVSMLCIKCHRP